MGKIKRNILLCEVCNKNKENVKLLKTYDGKLISACFECKKEMQLTLQIMKESAEWYLQNRDKLGKLQKSRKIGVLSLIDTIG